MNILFFGDIVGREARTMLAEQLPALRQDHKADFVIANGENAAGGFGITESICNTLFDAGVDVITLGNHTWDQRETLTHIEREPRLLRPANYPQATPGKGSGLFPTAEGKQVFVISLLGQVFMETLDNPFTIAEELLASCPLGEGADAIVVEIHAEASAEKMAMGHLCDGRVSLVVGTHTHIPTADTQILTGGTAYQTDAGMCGVYDSVIGMDKEEPLSRFTTRMRGDRFTPAKGNPTLCGTFVSLNPKTGLAETIHPIRIGGTLSPAP